MKKINPAQAMQGHARRQKTAAIIFGALVSLNIGVYSIAEEVAEEMAEQEGANNASSASAPQPSQIFSGEPPTLRPISDGTHYSPYVGERLPQELLWGDTHLHSSESIDANSAGNEKLSPAEAYRFARGEELMANSGQPVRLSRPLDFLVVSDHAEYLGVLPGLRGGDPAIQQSKVGAGLLSKMAEGESAVRQLFTDLAIAFINSDNSHALPEYSFNAWKENSATADQYNQPGTFTALIGYEWTYFPKGDNLHRVVVYKDGADKASAMPPFSSLDGQTPESLWNFMADYEKQTGGEILAIPHNSNVSNGRMFELQDSEGNAFTSEYNRLRDRWEPLVEVTQIKGDMEAHPYLSPNDEFADFENWDKGNLHPIDVIPKKPEMLQYEYARSALKLGLGEAARTGANPFKFGMIGSTDAHTSLATAAENNFWGKASMIEPGFERMAAPFMPSTPGPNTIMSWGQVASGYAAVWATENTREAIFAALKRKEVYATTGSRIALRFFAGWEFDEDDLHKPDRLRLAYATGVPMGSDLPALQDISDTKGQAAKASAPRFLVLAAKDPVGANLDRVQIVKGWLGSDGVSQEKVYNVAVSSDRKLRQNGKVKPIKSSVDLKTSSYTNSVGDAQLEVVWTDPDFDPAQRAFYYARVLEIPTPRWSEYDSKKYGFERAEETPRELQDRAYSSPIWYTPQVR